METLDLYGLAVKCPFDDECENCPFHELRLIKDFEQQVDLIDNMDFKQKRKLLEHHHQCRKQREIEMKISKQQIMNSRINN